MLHQILLSDKHRLCVSLFTDGYRELSPILRRHGYIFHIFPSFYGAAEFGHTVRG